MSDQYRFNIVGNAVTQVFEIEHGISSPERIEANETYTVLADGTVRKTETNRSYLEIEEYTDSNGDGIYVKSRKFYENLTGGVIASDDDENDRDGDRNDDGDLDDDGHDDDRDGDGHNDDHLEGGDDDDNFFGSLGVDSIRGGRGQDLLDGGDDDDDLFGEDDDDDLIGGLGNDHLDGGDGDDDLLGGSGNDDLIGGIGDDRLEAGDGNDTVNGGDGDDLIIGGSGRGNDVYQGGAGEDGVKYASATRSITVDLQRGSATGRDIDSDRLSDIEDVIGGSGSDRISGNASANGLEGGEGNDVLDGRSGDDYLVGGAGSDRMTGGLGADTFVLQALTDSGTGRNRDRISDFKHSQGDRLDLSALDADSTTDGDQGFTIVTAFSNDAGQLLLRGRVLQGDVNGDGRADFEIEVVGLKVVDLASDLVL